MLEHLLRKFCASTDHRGSTQLKAKIVLRRIYFHNVQQQFLQKMSLIQLRSTEVKNAVAISP